MYVDTWKAKTTLTQEKNIVEYFDELLFKEGVNLENELIVVACAHNTFGMYLSIKEINFVFLEDAAGLLSRPHILDDVNSRQNQLKYKLIQKYGLITGDNPRIVGYVCDFLAQDENFSQEMKQKSTDLCVVKEISALEEEERLSLLGIFINTGKIELTQHAVILLTQHFASLRVLSFEEQMSIYQVFIDYYLKGYNVVFKPHPDDVMFYPMLFPESEIIREKFPAEFMPFVFDNKPMAIATISSTSSFSLRSAFDDVIEMGNDFEREYVFTHKYYVALELYKILSKNKEITTYGCNVKMLRQLLRGNGNDYILKEGNSSDLSTDVVIWDKTETMFEDANKYILEQIEKTSFILMNTNNSFDFYNGIDKEIWNYIIPVVISKKPNGYNPEIHTLDFKEEVIYVVTQNERIKKMLKETSINKSLNHCGMNVSAKTLSDEQERIKILEGMLEATEKRMLFHMKQNEERGENI